MPLLLAIWPNSLDGHVSVENDWPRILNVRTVAVVLKNSGRPGAAELLNNSSEIIEAAFSPFEDAKCPTENNQK